MKTISNYINQKVAVAFFTAIGVLCACIIMFAPGVAYADSTPTASASFEKPVGGQSYTAYIDAHKDASGLFSLTSPTSEIGTFLYAYLGTIYKRDEATSTLVEVKDGDTFYNGTYYAYFNMKLGGAAFRGDMWKIDGLTCIFTLNGEAITPHASTLVDKTPTTDNVKAMFAEVQAALGAGGNSVSFYCAATGTSMINSVMGGYYKFEVTGAPEPEPTPDPDPNPEPEEEIPSTGDATPLAGGIVLVAVGSAALVIARKRLA